MAKKLSNLFFSTMKRAVRMQRRAMELAGLPVPGKRRKPVGKSATGKTLTSKALAGKTPTSKSLNSKMPAGRKPAAGTQMASKHAARKPVSVAQMLRTTAPVPAKAPAAGKGTWKNCIYKTGPSTTELLGRMAYSLYLPKGHAVAGLPLVVMMHGCKQTACDMALGTRMNSLADKKGFVVAYPQQARRVNAMRCWRWFQPDAAHGLAEADAVAGLALDLARRLRLDRSRIYIAGLSAGAGMAALAALRYPDLFAAAAMHSGAVVGAAHNGAGGLKVMRQASDGDPAGLLEPILADAPAFAGMPAIVLHGRRDHVVTSRNAVQLAQQFSYLNGASAVRHAVLARGTHREYARQDFLKGGRPVVRLCLLNEVGHAWSGGESAIEFNSETGPGASLLIWQFFAMHARQDKASRRERASRTISAAAV